ncbi:MAG TPA: PVC-type heme-binding CxxCH protein [Pirellulales bacterium]|nr:PVC-type heme-binding CxxCH protein [Pirellulales bacterium]
MFLFGTRFRAALIFVSPWLAAVACQAAHGAEFAVRGNTLRVPDGFTVRLAAEAPLLKYPVCADLDQRGRLYVCESSGSAEWNKPQPKESLHRVLRLEDANGDGVFDRRTVFAELEMMPEGSMWLDGSLYVAAPPVIWKLTDADGDGVAERREEWVKTETVTGCLNDLRGPYLGPDGYIYWCKGPATQTYSVDGRPWTSSARHILRRHPQGKDVDVLMVGGMDNLIEVAFAPGGERFVTSTLFQMLGRPRDDGILHAVYGAVYPKDIGPVFEFPWTGPNLMPSMTSWGAMSPAGLMCYQSTALGREYRGNFFSALFSGHKVLRHVLEAKGGTFASRDEEFLACDNVGFHPTDVLEDADGSLLVIETGGWYLRCCPSSTYYRPDVGGAIYRIRRTDAPPVADSRGAKTDVASFPAEKLVTLLDDARPVVRRRAIEQLGKLGTAALPAIRATLTSSASSESRCSAVWAATRINGNAARQIVRLAIEDRDDTVRHAALSSVSLHRDREAAAQLKQIVRSGSPQDRRVAAEALGRLRDRTAVPVLLEALASPVDRFVEHSLIYALIEIGDPESTRAALRSANSAVRRAGMIALDQMPGGNLEARLVIAELGASDPRMQDAGWWIVSRHPQQWGGLLADRLHASLADQQQTPPQRAALKERLARFARAPGLSNWIVSELTAAGVSAEARMLLLEAMGDAGGQFAEPEWVESLLRLLNGNNDTEFKARLIHTLGKLPPIATREEPGRTLYRSFNSSLLSSAHDAGLPAEARVQALAAVHNKSLGHVDDALFSFLVQELAPEQPIGLRTSAAEALARAQLTPQQLSQLAGSLKNLGFAELNVLLPLFQGSSDEQIGQRLVSSLLASSAATSLNAFRLRPILAGFGPAVQQEAEPLFTRPERAQAEQLAKAKRVLGLLREADPHRGIQVFGSQKAGCTACHKAANVGGVTGPHLGGVGKRRTERDLIESILFPSASLVQSYEPWTVLTDDGRTFNGVLLEDKPDEIVLSAGADKTYRLPRSSIEEMTRSEQSIMPTGLDKILSDQDLADLVAYLKSL